MNFTLNVTASAELLNTLNKISGVMETLLVTLPKTVIVDIITDNANTNNVQESITYTSNSNNGQKSLQENSSQSIQQVSQPNTYQNTAALQTIPTQQVAQSPQQGILQIAPIQNSAVPTSAQSYTLEQLAVAATQIVDTGRRTELVGLLNSFGVQALTALPKGQYGAFATQLRTLGAKI